MKKYIGIDLGGTNVRVARVDESGHIEAMVKSPTEIINGYDFVMGNILAMINQVDEKKECLGIGMGVPGPVDTVAQVMTMSSNLPGFAHQPIAEQIEATTGLPTFLNNDGNVAGLGEAILGAGRGCDTVYYVTLSTGIGGALVINQRVHAGKHGYAGEIGNLMIDRGREKINHLNANAVECEASGMALTRKGKELFGADIEHAGHVFDLARKHNSAALRLVDEMAYDLAYMFSLIAHICDPDVFVLGGGVMQGKDLFLQPMEAYFRTMIHDGMQPIRFEEAQLEEPGIIGAAMLPMSLIEPSNE